MSLFGFLGSKHTGKRGERLVALAEEKWCSLPEVKKAIAGAESDVNKQQTQLASELAALEKEEAVSMQAAADEVSAAWERWGNALGEQQKAHGEAIRAEHRRYAASVGIAERRAQLRAALDELRVSAIPVAIQQVETMIEELSADRTVVLNRSTAWELGWRACQLRGVVSRLQEVTYQGGDGAAQVSALLAEARNLLACEIPESDVPEFSVWAISPGNNTLIDTVGSKANAERIAKRYSNDGVITKILPVGRKP